LDRLGARHEHGLGCDLTIAVSFQNVTKRYFPPKARSGALVTDALSALGRLAGLSRPEPSASPPVREVLALDRVSFDVIEGQSFGMIGPNGAGKSTALKLLTRVSPLTEGCIEVRGRIGALLEVGSGVHPELSGRENIWLYGRILGMSGAVIREKFDSIVEFAELGHVLDMPVKRYSSGMQLRLGFSIASHIDPDIFVVDEALSVGDAIFQAKCVQRMSQFVEEGRTLIFVSHQLAAMESLCKRAAFINHGKLVAQGPVHDVLNQYLNWVEETRAQAAKSVEGPQKGIVKLRGASCHDNDGNERHIFGPRDYLEIRVRFESPRLERPNVAVGITDGRPGYLVFCSMAEDGQAPPVVGPGTWEVVLRIGELRLKPRLYEVHCVVADSETLVWLTDSLTATTFRVESTELGEGPVALMSARAAGALELDYEWDVRERLLGDGADGGLSITGTVSS
jgi:lipopolysaccharide transport system ATP-binding protein